MCTAGWRGQRNVPCRLAVGGPLVDAISIFGVIVFAKVAFWVVRQIRG
jgi:uncharacterized membrane protein